MSNLESIALLLLTLVIGIAYKKYLFRKWSLAMGRQSGHRPASPKKRPMPDLSGEDFSEGKSHRKHG